MHIDIFTGNFLRIVEMLAKGQGIYPKCQAFHLFESVTLYMRLFFKKNLPFSMKDKIIKSILNFYLH